MKARVFKRFNFKTGRLEKRWENYFSIVLLSVLFTVFVHIFFLKPDGIRYQALLNKEKKLKSTLEIKEKKIVFLEDKKQEFKRLNKGFNRMLKQMIMKGELSDFLEFISKIGMSCGLGFDLFSPLEEVNRDFYIEAPVSLILRGEYEQLLVFLSEVSRLSPSVSLHDFEIKKLPSNEAGKNPKELLVMKVTAKIYRHHD